MTDANAPTEPSIAVLDPEYSAVMAAVDSFAAADPAWRFQLVVATRRSTVIDVASDAEFGDHVYPLASVSKGIAGLAVALLVDRGDLDPDAAVSRYWAAFAREGKGGMTVAELLSHRAGLLGFSRHLRAEEFIGEAGAADLARQRPAWVRGAGHGYHAFTIGTLVDELIRRITGVRTADYFDSEIRRDRGIEVWLRLDDDVAGRVREVIAPPDVEQAIPTRGLQDAAAAPFASFDDAPFWMNSRRLLRAGVPSVSGVGTAGGLAHAYGTLLGDGEAAPLVSDDTIRVISQIQADGHDLVVGKPTRYGLLFQKPSYDLDFGTAAAFGHDGAGGSLGFADPVTGVAFGYVTESVPTPSRVDERALAIAQLVRRIALRDAR